MTSIAGAVHARLVAHAPLVALIGAVSGEPAVMIGDVVPGNVLIERDGPIVLVPDGMQSDADTGLNVRAASFNVRIYGTDSEALEVVARKVRALLHRWSAVVDDGEIVTSSASGPILAPTGNPVYQGRAVQVTLTVQE